MAAMSTVPRHEFVPSELQEVAYENMPLPIGYGKTISQPFMVALMTDLLEISEDDNVLEVGTGLGYQAAILAELASKVFTIEIIEELATEAKKRSRKVGYENIEFRVGDGSRGWAEHAPYDKIIVTAAPELIPTALLEQLRVGGRMVIPAGTEEMQQLLLVIKDQAGKVTTREIIPVLFSTLIVSH
jgi:protein-L-isoaspartate(D-aspartate) O-methyltransferase